MKIFGKNAVVLFSAMLLCSQAHAGFELAELLKVACQNKVSVGYGVAAAVAGIAAIKTGLYAIRVACAKPEIGGGRDPWALAIGNGFVRALGWGAGLVSVASLCAAVALGAKAWGNVSR